jgi:capsular exopolysaccharide synthesis family protein
MAQIKLITEHDKKSPVSEAYRTIRTNLRFAGADKPLKFIGVTSSIPSEGKSTTISNLAVVMAMDGKKVLLIDCDMRKPMIHRIFELPNRGVSNCIATGVSVESVIRKEVSPNLDILTSGPVPPNPSEMIGSEKMTLLLKQAGESYDYVLIDLPPVLPVTDAAVMSAKIDGMILVIGSGDVTPEEGKRTKEQLEQAGAHMIGVILNKVPVQHNRGYSYYYYYHYGVDDQQHGEQYHH